MGWAMNDVICGGTDDLYWYITDELRLGHGDGRVIEEGKTHTVEGAIGICVRGLHASRLALDALSYSKGPMVCRVRLGGNVIDGSDKSCASMRTYIKIIDAREILETFGRMCALDVIHLWDAPEAVRLYLETGRKDILEDAKNSLIDFSDHHGWTHPISSAWTSMWGSVRSSSIHSINALVESVWRRGTGSASTTRQDAFRNQNERLERMLLEAMGMSYG
jgi:hypothetical protein